MTFDKAQTGDKVRWCNRTFGLRPAEPWSDLVEVTEVEETYYGQNVTIATGEVLSSGLHCMAVTIRDRVAA